MAAKTAPVAADHWHAGGQPEALETIAAPMVNLAVWQRRMPSGALAEAIKLVVGHQGAVLIEDRPAQIETALAAAIRAACWPDLPCLCADAADLGQRFAAIMGPEALSLRLEIIDGDACRKFHADYVTARLITTYVGPGSEWLSNEDAAGLASGVPSGQLAVRRVRSGDVALFKGRRWSDSPIIHRSPPIEGTGQRRLVLVINPAEPGLDG
jgi:hypothetical protein